MADPLRHELLEGSGKLLWAAAVMEKLVHLLSDPPEDHAVTLFWLRRELFPEVPEHVPTHEARVEEGHAAAAIAEESIVCFKNREVGKSTTTPLPEIPWSSPAAVAAGFKQAAKVASDLSFLGDDDLTVTLSPEAQDFVARCENLAEDECAYAADTLLGIASSVKMSGRVTPGQVQAVDNIEAGAQRGREAREQRRYEGFGRGRR